LTAAQKLFGMIGEIELTFQFQFNNKLFIKLFYKKNCVQNFVGFKNTEEECNILFLAMHMVENEQQYTKHCRQRGSEKAESLTFAWRHHNR